MQGKAPVAVLRLGHRPGRDERTTTHVGLTARALGADRIILAGPAADRGEAITEVTERFGGPFTIESTDSPKSVVDGWDGTVVHLTMYGLPIQQEIEAIRETHRAGGALLVVVGAEKVPFELYERADWNLAVTNQPHSEIAALAVFLDRLYDGRELDADWSNADHVVVPQSTGKRVDER